MGPTVIALAPATGGQLAASIASLAACTPPQVSPYINMSSMDLANYSVKELTSNADAAKNNLPPSLSGDPVVSSIVNSIVLVSLNADRNVLLEANQPEEAEVYQKATQAMPSSVPLSNGDFEAFSKKLAKFAFDPIIETNNGFDQLDFKTTSASKTEFLIHLVAYYSAYYNGNFVDRFGNKFNKPTFSGSINDTDISDAVAVFVELLADEVTQTPVWTDNNHYYPAGSTDEPTALSSGLVTPTALVSTSSECGINLLKAQAIYYIGNAASTKASSLGGLVTGGFGGFEVGLGFLGKFSVGDNQTLQEIIKTILAHTAARAAEQASYTVLSRVSYDQNTSLYQIIAFFLNQK